MKYRGEVVEPTQQVELTIQFKDQTGTAIDTDSYPRISIVQPNATVFLAPTSVGVTRSSAGRYSYILTAPINGPLGIWNDIWSGYVNGFPVVQQFSFFINTSDVPQINIDGYTHLGDDPGFDYSQAAIKNINKLIKILKVRLNSSGKAKSTDSYGNTVYITCDIFSVETLVSMIAAALMDFNQVPYYTFFQMDDDNFVEQFGEVLVEGATLYALSSKALIERGREYQITDNGISFNLPTVSELLNTQYGTLLTNYWDKLKYIKNSLRPAPMGLGVFSMSSAINPAFARLRHLRARRIY